jgi:hypothetical protein
LTITRMRLVFLLFLVACFHHSFAQSSLKETLRHDFAESTKKPYSLHEYWYAKDTINISHRDTITFHNTPQYYSELGEVCKFLNWSFTSGAVINQSYYFPCVGHGYSITTTTGTYRFRIKQITGKVYLKLVNYEYQTYWFQVFRSLEYSARYKEDYPAITLVRLKHKPA